MRRSAAAALLLVALLVPACATHREADEPALRDAAHKEIAALLPRVRVWEDPALPAYLVRLVRRLTGATLRFHVLRDPTLNLFAMPTGEVVVHTGLLAVADNEAQVAAALAHEIAHLLGRDALEAGEPDPVAPRLDGAALASRTAAAIFALRLPVTARAAMTGHGRQREREADAAGLASLVRGGWDPREAPVMFLRLAAQSADGGAREVFFLGDRRRLAERIESIRALVESRFTAAAGAPDRVPGDGEFERLLRPVVRENAFEEIRQGRFALARAQLDRVARAAPDDAVLQLYYGDLHRLQAQRAGTDAERDVERAQAQAAYERALALDAGLVEAHRQLGLLHYAMRDLPRARAELERYLALAPGAPDHARVAEYVTELSR